MSGDQIREFVVVYAGPVLKVVLAVAAIIIWLAGRLDAALLVMLAAIVLYFLHGALRRQHYRLTDVDESVKAAVRDRRDEEGALPALEELRRHHPKTPTVDALRWIQRL